MVEDPTRRTYELVEDLRAEVDFEIDDVIANIIRNLPDEYFQSLTQEDQLTHLKALLAISICNLSQELVLRSEDARHVAVIARKNYPGLLAKIIDNLPDQRPMLGAKIFTSKTHDFIIDLFEFQTDDPVDLTSSLDLLDREDITAESARLANRPQSKISEFAERLHQNSSVLRSAEALSEHYLAFEEAKAGNGHSIRIKQPELNQDGRAKLTVATGAMNTRLLFVKVTDFLGAEKLDIELARLDDLRLDDGDHVAVCSFVVTGDLGSVEDLQVDLAKSLGA
jgi:hypothetical protein